MPAAGTSTSSSRIVVSGSLRWPPALAGAATAVAIAVAVAAATTPAAAAAASSSSAALVVALVALVCWFCWRSCLVVLVACVAVLALVAVLVPVLRCGPGSRSCAAVLVRRPGRRGPGCRGPGCGPGAAAGPAGGCAAGPGAGRGPGRRAWSWSRAAGASRRAAAGSPALGGSALATRPWARPWARSSARGRSARPATGSPAGCWPPDWAALIASTSCAFFMEPAPRMPRPPAIDFRSASSMELSPPALLRRRGGGCRRPRWWVRWFPSREVLPTYQCRPEDSGGHWSLLPLPLVSARHTSSRWSGRGASGRGRLRAASGTRARSTA